MRAVGQDCGEGCAACESFADHDGVGRTRPVRALEPFAAPAQRYIFKSDNGSGSPPPAHPALPGMIAAFFPWPTIFLANTNALSSLSVRATQR